LDFCDVNHYEMDNKKTAEALTMGAHERLGADSPVALLSHYLLRDIFTLARKQPFLYALGAWHFNNIIHTTMMRYDVAEDKWDSTSVAHSSWERIGCTVTAINDRLYVLGGRDNAYHYLSAMEVYDPQKNTWAMVTPMPTFRTVFSATVVSDHLFALGGWTAAGAMSNVEQYDPASDTWTIEQPLPNNVSSYAATAVGTRIFCFGGRDLWAPTLDVKCYDTKAGTWSKVSPMPCPRIFHTATAIGTRVYVTGGLGTMLGGSNKLPNNYYYDTAANAWAELPPTIGNICGTTASAADGKLFIAGHGNAQCYDPATQTWAALAPLTFDPFCLQMSTLYV
jgi:N-acetylneuraminic acid mutarotase